MREKDVNGLAFLIVMGILTAGAIIAKIWLELIYFSRTLFWASLVGAGIAFVLLIFFSVSYFRNKNDYFDEDKSGLFALICIGSIILLFIFARGLYDFGYSDEAIKTEMELKGYLEWYGEIMSLSSIPTQTTDKAVQEVMDDLCKDPTYPCEEIREGYEVYQEVAGMKGLADKVSKILLISKV